MEFFKYRHNYRFNFTKFFPPHLSNFYAAHSSVGDQTDVELILILNRFVPLCFYRRRPNDRLYVKMKETVDVFQNLYQVRNVTEKITDNHMDRIEKLRFNMVWEETIHLPIYSPTICFDYCLPFEGLAGVR